MRRRSSRPSLACGCPCAGTTTGLNSVVFAGVRRRVGGRSRSSHRGIVPGSPPPRVTYDREVDRGRWGGRERGLRRTRVPEATAGDFGPAVSRSRGQCGRKALLHVDTEDQAHVESSCGRRVTGLSRCTWVATPTTTSADGGGTSRVDAGRHGVDAERSRPIVDHNASWFETGKRLPRHREVVLTAAHLVENATDVVVVFRPIDPNEWFAPRLSGCARQGRRRGPDGRTHPGLSALAPARFGRVGGREATVNCRAVGFPRFKLRTYSAEPSVAVAGRPGRYRDSYQADGTIASLSNAREGTSRSPCRPRGVVPTRRSRLGKGCPGLRSGARAESSA